VTSATDVPGDLHELVFAPHALGDQPAAVRALRDEESARRDALLGAWSAEYGVLNRLVSLWALATPAPGATAGTIGTGDWLAAEPVVRRMANRRAFDAEAAAAPLLELRQYAPRPGQRDAFVAALLEALPYRERYSPCAGIWTTSERGSDVVVHLWGYRSFEARLQARAAAMRDSAWDAYRVSIRPMIAAMHAVLLVPVPR
jgi:hypothetical protein